MVPIRTGLRLGILVVLALLGSASPSTAEDDGLPASLAGPFIWEPAVIARLDQIDPKGCIASGPLVFGCLIQGQLPESEQQALDDARANPFNLDVARIIRATRILGHAQKMLEALEAHVSGAPRK